MRKWAARTEVKIERWIYLEQAGNQFVLNEEMRSKQAGSEQERAARKGSGRDECWQRAELISQKGTKGEK